MFLRVDFDVPLTPARGVADPTRIRGSLPTLKHLVERGARVVVGSHLGAPRGRPAPELSLLPIGAFLAEALGREVVLTDEPAGDGARKVVSDLREGEIALLENLRFSPGEEANEESFARALAAYADVYVNDAFSTANRAHASVAAIGRFFKDKAMGLTFADDLAALERLMGEVERPYVAVLGGTQVREKLSVLQTLIGRVDAVCVGGVLGNTLLRAKGGRMGRSVVEEDKLAIARDILTKAQRRDIEIMLPRDVVAGAGTRAESGRVVGGLHIPEDLAALDIGPETARAFGDLITRAKTILWSGPMGVFDAEPFAAGTRAVAKALSIATGRGAFSVVAGTDTAAATHRAGVAEQLSHLSTAGGAALEYLDGRKLPGLAALEAV